jgi:uncharacterized membrane protein
MRSNRLRLSLLVLAAIGVCLAGYLTYVHYSGTTVLCTTKHNTCAQVQKSRYSELVGVPVALLGLLGYIAILGTLLAREDERTRFATSALTLGGFGFSAYLTYRELFTLHKICEWCVSSAVIMTIMVCLATLRYLRGAGTTPQPAPLADSGAVDQAEPVGAARS